MTQKSVSLPKLSKEQRESEEGEPGTGRINKNFQKVKWSMAPKCLLEGHEGHDILYVCINPKCEEPSRLVCETCFFKSHKKHNEEFLAVDEIKNGEIEKLRYWPFEQKYRKMFEFVTKHESYMSTMIQDVNATFQVAVDQRREWPSASSAASIRSGWGCSKRSTTSTSARASRRSSAKRSSPSLRSAFSLSGSDKL